MIKLLVIADDLTGALDTGVQFARQGLLTLVTTDSEPAFGTLAPDLQVLVADTESRHLEAAEASARVRKIVASAVEAGIETFYKKTDSTLRGNIGAELEAALEASGHKALCFIPAFPKAGRLTREGIHYLENKPVHLTHFGLDPLDPVKTSSIVEILSFQSELAAAQVRIAELDTLGASLKGDTRLLVFDCSSDSDLDRIGMALKNQGLLGITAGSAGFAGVLPQMLELPGSDTPFPCPRQPLLLLNGSLNKTSIEQVRQAEKEGIRTYTLSPELLLDSTQEAAGKIQALAAELAREAALGHSVILRSFSVERKLEALSAGNHINRDAKDICGRISGGLGKVISAILPKAGFPTLAVFGGDTLIGVLKALQVNGIVPLGELSPGIVVSRISGASRELTLISKAGGFGEKDAIMRIINCTKGKGQ